MAPSRVATHLMEEHMVGYRTTLVQTWSVWGRWWVGDEVPLLLMSSYPSLCSTHVTWALGVLFCNHKERCKALCKEHTQWFEGCCYSDQEYNKWRVYNQPCMYTSCPGLSQPWFEAGPPVEWVGGFVIVGPAFKLNTNHFLRTSSTFYLLVKCYDRMNRPYNWSNK